MDVPVAATLAGSQPADPSKKVSQMARNAPADEVSKSSGKFSAVRAVGASINRPIRIAIGDVANAAPTHASLCVSLLRAMNSEKMRRSMPIMMAGVTNKDFSFRSLLNGLSWNCFEN